MYKIVRMLSLLAASSLFAATTIAQEKSAAVGTQAVVHFTFDEIDGPAQDRATIGQSADVGNLINYPAHIASPFWNQTGKKAIRLDASKQQALEIPDSPDVGNLQGITVSMFYVGLTDPADNIHRSLFAKRGTLDGKFSANYGINFQMQSDLCQVYIHDGTDYRVANYSSKAGVPFRKLTYITATYSVGDAPGTDADTDLDDVRMQYFVNGEPLTPKTVGRGFVLGTEAWTLDVQLAALLNKLPLTVGRTESSIEHNSCIIADFRVFARALSAEDVKRLFLEVAGANAHELIAADKEAPPRVPVIGNLSQQGLQTGQATQLVVNGSELGPESLPIFPLPDVRFSVAEGSTSNRLVLNVAVPAESVPGLYPFWIKSSVGISKATMLAIDRLPQHPMETSPSKAASLPAAFSGSLTGGQQQSVHFVGKKGQRVVADVELKRLGGSANPVLEIKSHSGSPLAIGWGQNALLGDARAELTLPSDGAYVVELHDLAFNAPGANSFRIKVGDLKLVDSVIPAAAAPGSVVVEPVGIGFSQGTTFPGQFQVPAASTTGLLALGLDAGFAGSLPAVRLSRGVEVVESATSPDGALQAVDATFSTSPAVPVALNGRIAKKGEKDRYLLSVTPGQKLMLTLQTDTIGSSLEGEIRIERETQGSELALTSDQPPIGDLPLEFTVPGEMSKVVVQVRDLFGRGDLRSSYRLAIEPANRPQFNLSLNRSSVKLPDEGNAVIDVQVARSGYDGPIHLNVVGDPTISLMPREIPAGVSGRMFLTLIRHGQAAAVHAPLLRLVGESVGVEPAIQQTARIPAGMGSPAFKDVVGVGMTASNGVGLELTRQPTILFRGSTPDLQVAVKRLAGQLPANAAVRLSVESTEPVRRRDANNPATGNFPVVSLSPKWILPGDPDQADLKLTVPIEAVEPAIDLVVRADVMAHAYSDRVIASAYSAPLHLNIQTAVAPKLDEESLSLKGEVDHFITGQLQRTSGFGQVVGLTLTGLPAGYTSQPVQVAVDQDRFQILVRAPKVATETPLSEVKLRVTGSESLLTPEMPVKLKVVPAT